MEYKITNKFAGCAPKPAYFKFLRSARYDEQTENIISAKAGISSISESAGSSPQ
ncbi:MAG: hypothetical protein LBP85_04085 [Prevotellaceae bacterium]|jgi:hypothetical protein|nr:hypothetical protein [Prevotellaceae bacterium]